MIKIKDYIFNENEINQIKFSTFNKMITVDVKYSNSYIDIEKATFDDIEWNYDKNNIHEEYVISQLKDYENKLKELEEENKKLKDELELKDFNYTKFRHLEESNDILKEELEEEENKIDKAIEYMENTIVFDVPSKMTLNDTYIIDSENYNKLLKILKGEENE